MVINNLNRDRFSDIVSYGDLIIDGELVCVIVQVECEKYKVINLDRFNRQHDVMPNLYGKSIGEALAYFSSNAIYVKYGAYDITISDRESE